MGEGPIWDTANTASSALLFPTRNVEWNGPTAGKVQLCSMQCVGEAQSSSSREKLLNTEDFLSVLVVIYSYKIGLLHQETIERNSHV